MAWLCLSASASAHDFICRCQLWHQCSLLSAFSRVFFHCRPLQRLSLWALTLVAASALALFIVVCDKIPMALFISVDFCDGFVRFVAALFIASGISIGFVCRYWLWWRLQHWLCSFVVVLSAGCGGGDYDCMYGFSRSLCNNYVSILSSQLYVVSWLTMWWSFFVWLTIWSHYLLLVVT